MLRLSKRFSLVLAVCIAVLIGGLTTIAVAQIVNNSWKTPTNVSRSGAASQPAIAVTADGVLHVLWWDATEGEQYARSTDITGTTWSQPVAVPGIVGDRLQDNATRRVTLIAPSQLQMLTNSRGEVYALWRNTSGGLQSAQLIGTSWSNVITLTPSSGVMGAMTDVSDTLHLAYIKLNNDFDGPAGVYYRANKGSEWTTPTRIYDSAYFRSAKPEEVHVGVVGDGQGHIIVTWDDPRTRESFYARSVDDGATWGEPQVVSGTQNGLVTQLHVAASPSGEFLLLWQEAGAEGCGITQRLSLDSGQTWNAPERVLGNATRCPERWSLVPNMGDGHLWLIGAAAPEDPAANTVTLAMWNGASWSDPQDVVTSLYDPASHYSVGLNCLNASLAGQTVGIVGCDPKSDIWATSNAVELDKLLSELRPSWGPVEIVSNRAGPAATEGFPALAADVEGDLYALWSQSTGVGRPGTALYTALQSNDRWSRATRLFAQSDNVTDATANKAEQPSIAADNKGRLHVVWSSGIGGGISYSWAYTRDVTSSQNWAVPVTLPRLTGLSQWPDIVVDPSTNALYVVYAAPFNERRGIYLVKSTDSGATWSQPIVVFDAAEAKWESVDKPRLALDVRNNVLHTVWLRAAAPNSVAPQEVFYARSTDGGQHWSAPSQIASGAVDWPRVAAVGPNQIYLAWVRNLSDSQDHSATPFGVWGQFSADGGLHWTEASAVHGFEQVSGAIDLVADGTGRLYLAGIGQSPNSESVLLVTQWNGQSWGNHEIYRVGQGATVGNSVKLAVAPKVGRLGAVLRMWTWNQSGDGQFEVMATNRPITASMPIVLAPTFTPLPPTPSPTIEVQPTPTPRPQLPDDVKQSSVAGSGPSPLVIGGLLATSIVLVVIGRKIWLRRQD